METPAILLEELGPVHVALPNHLVRLSLQSVSKCEEERGEKGRERRAGMGEERGGEERGEGIPDLELFLGNHICWAPCHRRSCRSCTTHGSRLIDLGNAFLRHRSLFYSKYV